MQGGTHALKVVLRYTNIKRVFVSDVLLVSRKTLQVQNRARKSVTLVGNELYKVDLA
jgi:hypothetical protein